MNIKIFQIDQDADKDEVKFRSLEYALEKGPIKREIYKEVYAGEVDAASLEDIYFIFNMDHPSDFTGHSLSVSDIVEIVDTGFFYCDRFGFRKVDFCHE